MEPVKEVPDLRATAESLIYNTRQYVETRLSLIILDGQEKVADTAGSIVTGAVLGIIGALTLFFLSIGVAWYIGELTAKPFIGFFIVGGFYALIGIVLYAFRGKWIQIPVTNGLIRKITQHEED